MRKAVVFLTVIFVASLLAACGAADSPVAEETPLASADPHIVDIPPFPHVVTNPRPAWKGFAATQPHTKGLAAYVKGDVDVYESPESANPYMTLDEATILGTTTVLGVLTPPENGWAQVMLPGRPNGSTGWVKSFDMEFYVADSQILIDLDNRRLTYVVGSVEVLSTEVGIGSRYNETPTGHFFVTDNVTLANPNSPWGPHALGLSARSETITEFNGGDGIIGIHGTNNPSSIGGNISLGCVRLPNEVITILHRLVPIGTRVTIEA